MLPDSLAEMKWATQLSGFQKCAHTVQDLLYNVRRLKRSTLWLASLKPGKFKMCEPVEVKNAPLWAHLPPWVTQGFSRASDETRTGIAPSFFARETDEGKRKGKGYENYKIGTNRCYCGCNRPEEDCQSPRTDREYNAKDNPGFVPDKGVIGYDFFNNFTVVVDRLGGKMAFVKN